MTMPSDQSSAERVAHFPLRVASTLCAIVGLVTVLGALVIGIPALKSETPTSLPLVAGLLSGAAVVAAALLVLRGRRLGGILIVAASIAPTLLSLLIENRFRAPPLLLILALITVLANWNQLR